MDIIIFRLSTCQEPFIMNAENETRGLNGMADKAFYRVGVIGTGMISGTYIDTMA